ncbi:hypothetical protein PF005_g30765 [Phytophthora fragariae]|nr:hypothetical protein PF009_g30071 [Phytophthora fragariae]KAE8963269.1 hypothetical protein PF011_g29096 [Phytophthora fragariae]KAE9062184.1 hypothetical protein PF007_g30004 [Phytophthora fragariae]KAE9065309.1 hypothetical protein PF006_g30495 [Phytophthora fragariae]KAE9162660.1 hypothetical protein PF005_g30765 [Phytophthora fragariae]
MPKPKKPPGTNSDTEGAETTPALQLQQATTLQDQEESHLSLVGPDRPAVRQKFAAGLVVHHRILRLGGLQPARQLNM